MSSLLVFALLLLGCYNVSTALDSPMSQLCLSCQPCVKSLSLQLKDLKTQIQRLRTDSEVKQVAFTASLLESRIHMLGPLNKGTPLVFEHIITNVGHAYNNITGCFIAPVKGVYHFEWHLSAWDQTGAFNVGAFLVKNGHNQFVAYGRTSEGHMSVSNGGLLLLEAGDVVSLSATEYSNVYDDQGHHSTFSGHIVCTL